MKKHILSIFAISLSFALSAQITIDDAAKKFGTLLNLVDRAYVDSTSTDDLVETAIVSMLKDMDPHSVYISKEDLVKMNEPLVGNFEGVGIQFNIFEDTIMVVSPISGGPSEELGILSGDRIVTIEGENVAGIGIKNKDVMEKLRGDKGSKVTVGIKRRGVKKIIDFTITRAKIPIFSVDAAYMAAPDVGYIKVNRFAATTMKEFDEGLTKLQAEGMKHLILDLRGNSGGYLSTAIKLADEFLSSRKLIVYTEGRSFPKDEKFATSIGNMEQGKVVVLINEGSASASEIVSGAIQDHDRGLVIGRRSFGKGLVQKPYSLPDGSAVRLTISRYYTPTGRCIQKSYEGGVKEYHKDLSKRFESGELFNQDSIDFPDSLKFTTPNGRTVYGGGGIMPDIFIPLDTTMSSDYYTDLSRKGIFNRFNINYMDGNRKKLSKTHKTLADFKANFTVDQSLVDEFTAFGVEEGVDFDEEGYKTSEKFIKTQIKAMVARALWQTEGYFYIINDLNDSYQEALKVMQDDTFEKMNLRGN
jgi:carboxyl-terminal processing protease